MEPPGKPGRFSTRGVAFRGSPIRCPDVRREPESALPEVTKGSGQSYKLLGVFDRRPASTARSTALLFLTYCRAQSRPSRARTASTGTAAPRPCAPRWLPLCSDHPVHRKFAPRDPDVEQVSPQHRVVLGQHRDHRGRISAAGNRHRSCFGLSRRSRDGFPAAPIRAGLQQFRLMPAP